MPEHGGPLLDPRRHGPAQRAAAAVGSHGPVATFFATLIGGFVVLAALATLLGLLVTHVLLTDLHLGGPDGHFVRDLVADRSPALTTVSEVGTTIGGAPLLPIAVGLLAIVLAVKRHWLVAAYVAFLLLTESATYRVASLLVPRDRPHVHRLEDLPANASYPSGHTAAAVAVYCGLALLVTPRLRSGAARAAVWAGALLIPVFVAFSRMYRGMHHPLDTLSGAAIGAGAIVVVLLACRAAAAASPAHVSPRRSASRPRPLRLTTTTR